MISKHIFRGDRYAAAVQALAVERSGSAALVDCSAAPEPSALAPAGGWAPGDPRFRDALRYFILIRQLVEEDPRASTENPMFELVEHPGVGTYPMPGSPLDFAGVARAEDFTEIAFIEEAAAGTITFA